MIYPKEPRFTQFWIGITPIYVVVQVLYIIFIDVEKLQSQIVLITVVFTVAAGYVLNSVLGPALGLPLNPKAAAEAEQLLTKSLSTLETFWLKGSAKFLLGGKQPSIADLSLVCELMQLQVRKKIIFFTNFYLFY